MRFEPPPLAEVRPKNVHDEHAQQLAAAMQRAREEGLRQARAEVDATLEAHELARRELLRVTRLFAAAIEQVEAHDRDDLSALEDDAVGFAFDVAEELVGRELRSCDDLVAAAIARAIELVPDRGALQLRVHPLDADAARDALQRRPELTGRADVVSDGSVEPGGCVAVVGPLRIDAQLGPAMQRVRTVISGQ